MSRVKPILFNIDMVRAILDGRKTVTRRLIKVPSYYPHFYKLYDNTDGAITGTKNELFAGFYKDEQVFYIDGEKHIDAVYHKAPCKPGDILYVRETWQECCRNIIHSPIVHDKYCFKASIDDSPLYGCIENDCGQICEWRPSIHMPKEAARIWLRVTDVNVERLQDITEDEAIAEGANWKNGKNVGWEEKMRRTAVERFAERWNSAIKKKDLPLYGWNANPWVWVIEFEQCKRPEEI